MGRSKERITESQASKWLKRRLVKDGKVSRATKVRDVGYTGHLRLLWKYAKEKVDDPWRDEKPEEKHNRSPGKAAASSSRRPPPARESEEESYMSDESTWSLPGLDGDPY